MTYFHIDDWVFCYPGGYLASCHMWAGQCAAPLFFKYLLHTKHCSRQKIFCIHGNYNLSRERWTVTNKYIFCQVGINTMKKSKEGNRVAGEGFRLGSFWECLAESVGADLADVWRKAMWAGISLPGLWGGEGAGAQPGQGMGGDSWRERLGVWYGYGLLLHLKWGGPQRV